MMNSVNNFGEVLTTKVVVEKETQYVFINKYIDGNFTASYKHENVLRAKKHEIKLHRNNACHGVESVIY